MGKFCYIDDIVVKSKHEQEHLENLAICAFGVAQSKNILALVFAAQKLRHYMLEHTVQLYDSKKEDVIVPVQKKNGQIRICYLCITARGILFHVFISKSLSILF
ncbi:hypothetical protein ACJX0J_021546, partial [Zea mays]